MSIWDYYPKYEYAISDFTINPQHWLASPSKKRSKALATPLMADLRRLARLKRRLNCEYLLQFAHLPAEKTKVP